MQVFKPKQLVELKKQIGQFSRINSKVKEAHKHAFVLAVLKSNRELELAATKQDRSLKLIMKRRESRMEKLRMEEAAVAGDIERGTSPARKVETDAEPRPATSQ